VSLGRLGSLANRPHTGALSCARMRVETSPPPTPGGYAWIDVPVSRTGPENQDDCPPPIIATGSDQQQHACHPARASVSASVKPESTGVNYEVVRAGREWS
jgi:hypothetical protein